MTQELNEDGLLFPVYEFRPLREGYYTHRYANGQWIEDDGEYDLAFARRGECLMVELTYHRNIIWSWLSGSWTGSEPKHPRSNPWHYMLRDGETDWGDPWGRDRHPNAIAGKSGMSFAIKGGSSASGKHVEFRLNDKHIAAGLLREKDTGKIVKFPEKPICMYCDQAKENQAYLSHPRVTRFEEWWAGRNIGFTYPETIPDGTKNDCRRAWQAALAGGGHE